MEWYGGIGIQECGTEILKGFVELGILSPLSLPRMHESHTICVNVKAAIRNEWFTGLESQNQGTGFFDNYRVVMSTIWPVIMDWDWGLVWNLDNPTPCKIGLISKNFDDGMALTRPREEISPCVEKTPVLQLFSECSGYLNQTRRLRVTRDDAVNILSIQLSWGYGDRKRRYFYSKTLECFNGDQATFQNGFMQV